MRRTRLLLSCTLVASCAPRELKVVQSHDFHDFRFGDRNAGYFEIRDDGSEIFMNAVFEMKGERYENPFGVRYEHDRVLAFRMGDGDWVDFATYPANHYPTSAYPLLLRRLQDRLEYQAVEEGTGDVLGKTLLERVGDTVTETRNGKVVRKYVLRDGKPVEIEWGGGAVSHIAESYEDAVKGSPFEESEPRVQTDAAPEPRR